MRQTRAAYFVEGLRLAKGPSPRGYPEEERADRFPASLPDTTRVSVPATEHQLHSPLPLGCSANETHLLILGRAQHYCCSLDFLPMHLLFQQN